MPLPRTTLGRTGLSVTRLGIGGAYVSVLTMLLLSFARSSIMKQHEHMMSMSQLLL